MKKKLIIGIVSKHRSEDREALRSDSRIRDEAREAIFDNGALAIGILMPNNGMQLVGNGWEKYEKDLNKEDLIAQVKLCDGIVLQGGNASEPHEPFIAKYCYEHDIPCLGLCGGQHAMVRALGGYTKEVSNPHKHYAMEADYVHPITIKENSKFYSIVKTKEMMVNSRHIKYVAEAPHLQMVGFDDDGYPDVIEDKKKTFYIGVRFHPESLYKKDEKMNAIFKAFLKSCKKKKSK